MCIRCSTIRRLSSLFSLLAGNLHTNIHILRAERHLAHSLNGPHSLRDDMHINLLLETIYIGGIDVYTGKRHLRVRLHPTCQTKKNGSQELTQLQRDSDWKDRSS